MPEVPYNFKLRDYTTEQFIQEKLFYYQTLFELEHTFQKNLLNSSSGALILSVTLFQIFKPEDISNLSLLIMSWAFLFISSFLSMKRFIDGKNEIQESIRKLNYFFKTPPYKQMEDRAIENLEEFVEKNQSDRIERFPQKVFNNTSNIWTIIFITLGILSLITFFLTNL